MIQQLRHIGFLIAAFTAMLSPQSHAQGAFLSPRNLSPFDPFHCVAQPVDYVFDFTIPGRITDSCNHPVRGVSISLYRDTLFCGSVSSDSGGYYSIAVAGPGTYTLKASLDGYISTVVHGIYVSAVQLVTRQDVHINKWIRPLTYTVMADERPCPIIVPFFPYSPFIYTANTNDLTAEITPGIYQPRRGDELSIFGSRPGGVLYIVDGMQIMR